MARTLTCPIGHDWDGDPADCPDCADDSWDHSGASTFQSKDELPPPPMSVRVAAPTKRDDRSASTPTATPVIPGYEVLGELGRGGMGTVYRARHLALNRLVALKVISAGAVSDTREQARFRTEAELVAQLQHPNIVQVHEVGDVDGRQYLALELVTGETLAQALVRSPLSAQTAAEFIETVARAVQHAHANGIVHRDLKPSNILLGYSGPIGNGSPDSIKVADFGLAKRMGGDSAQTTTGVVVGTPSYMAPEQAAGLAAAIGPPCDIYALGAILYELLTGRPPFRAASALETMQQVISVDPVPPSRLQPKLPRDLETICLKCLQKESRKRYASAAALADDLRRFLDGEPILARRTPVWERAAKWARRRPAAAAFLAVSLIAIVTVGGLSFRHARSLERHNEELAKAAADLTLERDEAKRQSERAEVNLESAVEAIEQMLKRVGIVGLLDTPYMDRTRAALLEDALRFFDRLLRSQAGDPRLRLQRAHTLELCGRVSFALGRFDQAHDQYNAALAQMDELDAQADSPVPRKTMLWLRALILNNRSLTRIRLGEITKARADQEISLGLREKLLELQSDNPDYEHDVAASNLNLALIAHAERRSKDMELYLGRARPRAEALTRDHGDEDRYWYLLGRVLNDSAVLALEDSDEERAVELNERGVAIWRKLLARERGSVEYRSALAQSLTNLGAALLKQGFVRKAATPLQEALRIREQFAREHPDSWLAVMDVTFTQLQVAEWNRLRNEHEAALSGYALVIEQLESNADRLRADYAARDILASAFIGRANAMGATEKYVEMAAALARAMDFVDAPKRLELRMTRALALAHTDKIDDAIKEAETILAEPELEGEVVFNAARIFARKASATPGRKEEYAAKSVANLIRTEKTGYFRAAKHRRELELHMDLEVLRSRGDFKALRARVER